LFVLLLDISQILFMLLYSIVFFVILVIVRNKFLSLWFVHTWIIFDLVFVCINPILYFLMNLFQWWFHISFLPCVHFFLTCFSLILVILKVNITGWSNAFSIKLFTSCQRYHFLILAYFCSHDLTENIRIVLCYQRKWFQSSYEFFFYPLVLSLAHYFLNLLALYNLWLSYRGRNTILLKPLSNFLHKCFIVVTYENQFEIFQLKIKHICLYEDCNLHYIVDVAEVHHISFFVRNHQFVVVQKEIHACVLAVLVFVYDAFE